MKVAFVEKPGEARARSLAQALRAWLEERGSQVVPIAEAELVVALGGDGTLLHAARALVGSKARLLGINLGRLGFLADVPPERATDALEDVLAGRAGVRRLAAVSVEADAVRDHAINDVVLYRGASPKLIEFELYAGGSFVFRLRGDGLIVATPAGSTAYALSAGGPIVHSEVSALTVAPICPHTLSNRPIVLPETTPLELVLLSDSGLLSVDGRAPTALKRQARVHLRAAGSVALVRWPGAEEFAVLRTKLGWAGHRAGDAG
ncbi:MAG: hypothetical protein D6771_01725 [Zetaproteobacteria bacterium]|nr:MAG: hypothetical protein D6771_01725 [Zetaproteobacteria bacterium]